MKQRGRRSAASLTVVPAVPLERPAPPRGLPRDVAAEWAAIVARMPVDWFGRETHALLAAYCRAVVTHRRVSRAIDGLAADALRTADGRAAFDRLTKMQERQMRALLSLGRALRLTIGSRRSAKVAATAVAAVPREGERPWER